MGSREDDIRESLRKGWSYAVAGFAQQIGDRRYDFNEEALTGLVRDLAALRRSTPPATVATRVLMQVSRSRVVEVRGDRVLTRNMAVQAAFFVCADLLAARGRQLDSQEVPALRRLLAREPVARRDLKVLLERIVIRASPRPVLLVLTPYSQIDENAKQERLLAVADRLDDSPLAKTYRIVVPGRDLHPDDEIVGDRHDRAVDERRLVVGASLVVLIAAEHDSWGGAKCVAWAESALIPTLVYTTRPEDLSRVLAYDVPTTRYLLFDSIENVANDIINRVQNMVDPTPARQRQRQLHDKIGQSLHRLFIHTRRARDHVPQGLLARARAVSVSGDDALTLTITELLALKGHFPGFVEEILHKLFGADFGHDEDADPSITAGLNFDDLTYFCTNRRLSSVELVDLLREYTRESRSLVGALRRQVTLDYLDQLLTRVRAR